MKAVLGVTGGISAYKSAHLARIMIKNNWQVKTVMSREATRFITQLTFKSLTMNRVYDDIFDEYVEPSHISLSKWADFIVVAPSTANTLAKIAAGIADSLLTCLILDFSGPVFLAPAMHTGMWQSTATIENVQKLKKRGFLFIGPREGELACGDSGPGRMSSPETIFDRINKHFKTGVN